MKDRRAKGKRSEPKQMAREAREASEPALDADLVRALTTPNIWPLPPVDAQPRVFVSPWSVHRATPKDGQASDLFGLHFVGRNLREWSGCVSSKIISFDATAMCGTTGSGRVYELDSQPGHCLDGDYVLNHWADFNNVDVEDVTEEFMKTHGVTREKIANRERSRDR